MIHLGVLYLMRTFVIVIEVPPDNVTYNWPCEKTFCGKYTLTYGIVWPCVLFIVIAKLNRIGNWDNLKWKGYPSFSASERGILGSNTCFPAYFHVIISADITFDSKPLHIILVPLQSPFDGSKFCKSMIRQFFFKTNLWGGGPFGVSVFKILLGNNFEYHQLWNRNCNMF